MVRKDYLVVAYDIRDNKRRNKICDILCNYGKRVNYSVFECFLGKNDINELKKKIEKCTKKSEDIILYYHLCKNCVEKIERVGKPYEERSTVKII
jgi:CRISPR-associated protein Cas2